MLFLTLVLLFSVFAGCSHHIRENSNILPGIQERPGLQEGQDPIKEGLSLLDEWRSGCEQRVKMLKEFRTPESDEYREAYVLYIKTKTKSDAWLQTLITDLQLGGKPSKRYDTLLAEAANLTGEFESYVESLKRPKHSTQPDKGLSDFLTPINVGSRILEKLTIVGIQIWGAWRKVREEEKVKTINLIEGKKWLDFNDIK